MILQNKKIFFLFSLINFILFAQKPVQKFGLLKVNNSHVTSENGTKVSLPGISLFWSTAGDIKDFYNARTVDHLAQSWNVSFVRAVMGIKESWDGGNGYIDNPTLQKSKIKKVIDAAIANNIYVIVDWHSHNAENYTAQAVQFFSEIAKEYGDNKHIIYEIYNEPIGGESFSAQENTWKNTIKPYAIEVINAIRAEDSDNLIIVGTPFFSQGVDVVSNAGNPIKESDLSLPNGAILNVAYTLHFYAGTHNTALRAKAKTAMDNGLALFITEWGTVPASGNGAVNSAETDKWVTFMKDNYISHANWAIADKAETSNIILPGKGVEGLINDELTESGILVKKIIQEQNKDLGTLSINDINPEKESTTILYPNPSKDTIFIKSSNTIKEYSIHSIEGKEIINSSLNSKEIDISNLAFGSYILKLKSSNNKVSSYTIIKK